ncbi:MAG: CAP domain-containing protein [Thermoanaerobaculia bacterium]
MVQRFQWFAAFAAVLVMAFPTSAFAENRSRGRTQLEQLAAELEAKFGRGSVVVEGAPRAESTGVASIVEAMNRERAAYGLRPLRLNEKLSMAAGDRIEDMFAKNYFAHVSPDGIEPFVWARKRGYRYSIIGENLAVGYRGTAVVDGWMRSPGHRENILQRQFDEVGLAIADGSPRRGYRGPTVVALYGSR